MDNADNPSEVMDTQATLLARLFFAFPSRSKAWGFDSRSRRAPSGVCTLRAQPPPPPPPPPPCERNQQGCRFLKAASESAFASPALRARLSRPISLGVFYNYHMLPLRQRTNSAEGVCNYSLRTVTCHAEK